MVGGGDSRSVDEKIGRNRVDSSSVWAGGLSFRADVNGRLSFKSDRSAGKPSLAKQKKNQWNRIRIIHCNETNKVSPHLIEERIMLLVFSSNQNKQRMYFWESFGELTSGFTSVFVLDSSGCFPLVDFCSRFADVDSLLFFEFSVG